jgi:hypothetical protein
MPATDLYLETTTNSTFPFRNHTMDISGTAGTAGISNSSHGTNGSAAGRAGTNGSSSQGGAVGRMAPLVSGIIVMVLAALSGFLL